MSIRAKFKCHRVTKDSGGNEMVNLSAVYGDDNKPWSKFTPNGDLSMTISNPEAQGFFEPNVDYYLDVTKVVGE